MSVILYGILLAHLNAYKDYYGNIFINFAITYLLKRLIKSAGNKEHAELIGLAGYSLSIREFVKLLSTVKQNAKAQTPSEEVNKAIGGLVGGGIDWFKDLFVK